VTSYLKIAAIAVGKNLGYMYRAVPKIQITSTKSQINSKFKEHM